MAWPLSQDYNEAIQDPANAFAENDLKAGHPVVNALGIPMPRSGNFADVYEFVGAPGTRWAIKCFTREVAGLQARYSEISRHLRQTKLPFTVDFQYLPQGIRVGVRWYPILKMHWVDGLLLNEFVRGNLDKPAVLDALGQIWLRMAKRLREADIAHADLQHGNVILVPGSRESALAVKLIDYDGMYVPALAQRPSGEVGHPAYQHPQRLAKNTYNVEVDRTPLLAIACALRALAVGGKALWQRHDNGDNLLFRESDFRRPGQSPLFQELWNLPDPAVHDLVGYLTLGLLGALEYVPLVQAVVVDNQTRPLNPHQEKQVTAVLGPGARTLRQPAVKAAAAAVAPAIPLPVKNSAGVQHPAGPQTADVELLRFEADRSQPQPPVRSRRPRTSSRKGMWLGVGLAVLAASVVGFVVLSQGTEDDAGQKKGQPPGGDKSVPLLVKGPESNRRPQMQPKADDRPSRERPVPRPQPKKEAKKRPTRPGDHQPDRQPRKQPDPKPRRKPSPEPEPEPPQRPDNPVVVRKPRTEEVPMDEGNVSLPLMAQEVKAAGLVLIRQSMTLAARSGDLNGAFAAIDALPAESGARAFDLKVAAVKEAVSSPHADPAMAGHILELVQEAVELDRFGAARQLLGHAKACAGSGGKDLVAALRARAQDVDDVQEEYERIEPEAATLKAKPDDPEANLAWGKYLCIWKGAWCEGLSHLSKGSDSALAKAARKDLARPSKPSARLAVADGWKELTAQDLRYPRTHLFRRAMQWYQRALPKLADKTEHDRIEKEIRQIGRRLDALQAGELPGAPAHLLGTWEVRIGVNLTAKWSFRADQRVKSTEQGGRWGTWKVQKDRIRITWKDRNGKDVPDSDSLKLPLKTDKTLGSEGQDHPFKIEARKLR
jgi:hypothetical protein